MLTIADYINRLPKSFTHEKAKGLNGRMQLTVLGEVEGKWHVIVDDGNVSINEGELTHPDVEVNTDEKTAIDIFNGKKPMAALLTGKLKIKGDKALLMKMVKILTD